MGATALANGCGFNLKQKWVLVASKDGAIEIEGSVAEALPTAMFRVELIRQKFWATIGLLFRKINHAVRTLNTPLRSCQMANHMY